MVNCYKMQVNLRAQASLLCIIFPEINIDKVSKIRGMDITFVTTAKTDNEAMQLLKEFGLPFRTTGSN